MTFFLFFFFVDQDDKNKPLLPTQQSRPFGPVDKAPAYGAGDRGFKSRNGLVFFFSFSFFFPGEKSLIWLGLGGVW
jgi:hypothetical protein